MDSKKFKAPNGRPDIRIAMTSGHTCMIGQEFVELVPLFWPEAYAAGALSEDMTEDRSVKQALIEKAKEMQAEEDEFFEFLKDQLLTIYNKPTGNIDKNGNPLYRKVISLVKKTVKKDIIEKAWTEIKQENESE